MRRHLVIIGGGAGGASTAAEAKRIDPDLQITMIEQGKHVSVAACPMPYFVGDTIKQEHKLIARTPEAFRESGVDVLLKTRVERVDTDQRRVYLSDGPEIVYDRLLVATGASPILPGIPGQDLDRVYTLRSLEEAIAIKALVQSGCRRAVIIGAGFIAMEMSDALTGFGLDVRIAHRDERPVTRWGVEFTERLMSTFAERGVLFMPKTTISRIDQNADRSLRLTTNQGEIETDLVVIAIGIRPNVTLAKAMGLQLGDSGAIRVNLSQQTSVANVYATGDCTEVYHRVARRWVNVPLGDIANKQGRVAGQVIGGRPAVMPGIVGAQSFKFFDLELAATGLGEQEAVRYGFHPVSATAWAPPTAPSMRQKEDIETGLKLIADQSTGMLLGAQAVGRRGAVQKIDVLSATLWYEARLDDLASMDFGYAPPFGGAWDLIHIVSRLLLKKL